MSTMGGEGRPTPAARQWRAETPRVADKRTAKDVPVAILTPPGGEGRPPGGDVIDAPGGAGDPPRRLRPS